MGDSRDWPLYSERVFPAKGKPAKMGLIAITLVAFAFLMSILGLFIGGRLDSTTIDFDLLLSSTAATLFFGVFGWGALFLKHAYYDTINHLKFKDEDSRARYLERETVFSDKHVVVGVFLTYSLLGVAMLSWPLFSSFFPLTLELLPFFLAVIISMGLVGILAVDAVGAIPSLLILPRDLKDDIQINILLPDRCGGAKSIGDFYFVFTLLVAAIGSLTVVIASSFEIELYGYVLAVSFLILAIAVFLFPQMSFRSVLKKEKLKRLEEIADRIELLSKQNEQSETEEVMIAFIQVQSLIMLYGEIEKLREFPFEIGTFQKVISTALVPILIEILIALLQFPW